MATSTAPVGQVLNTYGKASGLMLIAKVLQQSTVQQAANYAVLKNGQKQAAFNLAEGATYDINAGGTCTAGGVVSEAYVGGKHLTGSFDAVLVLKPDGGSVLLRDGDTVLISASFGPGNVPVECGG